MLPEFLAGSYQRYKQDTALFTTWLAQGATACGYNTTASKARTTSQVAQSVPVEPLTSKKSNADPPPTGRLKGKDRKAAKLAAAEKQKTKGQTDETSSLATTTINTYTVTTKELLAQAEAIAGFLKPRVILPASLQGVIERAIEARRRCSRWFQQSKVRNEYSDESDRRHAHFIGVLEESLKVLSPCLRQPSGQSIRLDQTPDTSAGLKEPTNRFAMLEIEEPPEIDSIVMQDVPESVATTKSPSSKKQAAIEIYELEDIESADDLAFEIFCFFEDLHRIQDYVGELWTRYRTDEIDHQTAAVTTNAAMELVNQEEEKVLAKAPDLFNRKRSWDTIAIIIFYADAFEKGICPETRLSTNETLRITPFDDFIYLSTARILMKFTFLSELPPGTDGPAYPIPCFPLRMGYVSRPELLGTPEMDIKEQEDRRLSQYIMDKHLWFTYKREISKQHESGKPMSQAPMEDEFSKHLEHLLTEGVISVSLVFASQIFLNIQDILQDDIGKGYRDLKDTTATIDKIINLKIRAGAFEVGGSGERWHEKNVDTVMRIKSTSTQWITDLPFMKFKDFSLSMATVSAPSQSSGSTGQPNTRDKPKPPKDPKFNTTSMALQKVPVNFNGSMQDLQKLLRQDLLASGHIASDEPPSREMYENAMKLDIKIIEPSKNMALIFSTNPIYCGLLAFDLITSFERAGIDLCNWHKTPWVVAHLYNTLRLTSAISKRWPELEQLINIHVGDLFSGQIPLSAEECFVRFGIFIGLSPSSFARSQRNGNADPMSNLRFRHGMEKAVENKLRTTLTADIFRQYFEHKISLETCLFQIEDIFQKGQTIPKKARSRAVGHRPLTVLQFLDKLQVHLEHLVDVLRFDYVTLTKQCTRVLKTIRQDLELELQVRMPVLNTTDSADQSLVIMVYRVLQEARDAGLITHSIRNGPLITASSPQLELAGKVLEKFLVTYNPEALLSNFNSLPRIPRAPSGLVPNHWHVSIRHVPIPPPGDLVFFCQPESHYVHVEGPIQIAEGQLSGHVLNPKSLATLQVIARLMMKAFSEGLGGLLDVSGVRPWSWSTNDGNFARRITKVMRDLGVEDEALLNMPVGSVEENMSCDEDWANFLQETASLVRER